MNKGDHSKSMIIISAPKGTSLEAGEDEKGGCMLKMDSTGKGPIKVYTCKGGSPVKELEPSKN